MELTGCISVTIQAETTMKADALATAVFVLGPEKGLNLVEALENIEAVILYEENGKLEHVVSEGLKELLIVKDERMM